MELYSLFDPKWTRGDFRPKIDAYYYKQWVDFHMGFHAHGSIEIMYVIAGTCRVETQRQSIPMGKGEFILLDSGVIHRLVVEKDSPCRMLNVEFTFTACDGIHPSLAQTAANSPALRALLGRQTDYIVMSDPSDVYHTLKSLVMELDAGVGVDNGSMVHLLISQLLIRIARLAEDKRIDHASRQTDRYVRKAVEYIHQHYDCDIQAKDISAAVNLHPVYLQRIFRTGMNVTMADYLANVRIGKAKMLLAQTDIPIAEIADYVGLNSRQYFSLLFKKMTGDTPAAYRRSVETLKQREPNQEVVIVDMLK
ncbi:helix-turn-helix domain-containing protein [Paenibacillus spongiae]|uniref:AraC family transcriptional regulator n=1 Tax=Paenibacillus spongiae TaxID=2909671 RepID=A0ABY5S8Z3_9BACL|nr:AraC family transcriptional regulator [Paenibacillus spongiae]UVI28995.1 AraC family transcriptional regulator [Paenibacillus spongiae]